MVKILMEMSEMWKITGGHTDDRRTMANRPWYKLTWSKPPGELTIEELQDGCRGGHRGYCYKMVLAILNLHVAPMPPIKFWLSPTSHSWADEVWRFSRWPPGLPSWISEQNDFSSCESLHRSDASALRIERCHFKNFKEAAVEAILDIGMQRF